MMQQKQPTNEEAKTAFKGLSRPRPASWGRVPVNSLFCWMSHGGRQEHAGGSQSSNPHLEGTGGEKEDSKKHRQTHQPPDPAFHVTVPQ